MHSPRPSPALALATQVKDFYKFWEGHQEAWDGPALLVWSDGKHVGASLDRNGLRPARYMTLKDGTVIMMSETGVVPIDESQVRASGVRSCSHFSVLRRIGGAGLSLGAQ